MKKWYFSKNSKISGPFNISEAKVFLQNTPDVYGWHPSFSQWQPASQILEFADVVPTPVPPAQIPPELIAEFINKKQNLHNQIDKIDHSIEFANTHMYELNQEIKIYKRITQNLSEEVKENINSIEVHYKTLHKTLAGLKQVTDIANSEIEGIIEEFESRIDDKNTHTPTKAVISSQTIASSGTLKNNVTKETVEQTTESKISLISSPTNVDTAIKVTTETLPEVTPKTAPEKTEDNIYSIDTDTTKESKGFGSKLRSVLTPLTGKPANATNDLDDALAELVASSDITASNDLSSALNGNFEDDDEEQKTSRMRRRRRRR